MLWILLRTLHASCQRLSSVLPEHWLKLHVSSLAHFTSYSKSSHKVSFKQVCWSDPHQSIPEVLDWPHPWQDRELQYTRSAKCHDGIQTSAVDNRPSWKWEDMAVRTEGGCSGTKYERWKDLGFVFQQAAFQISPEAVLVCPWAADKYKPLSYRCFYLFKIFEHVQDI